MSDLTKKDDKYWMQQALLLARQAENIGEVPIGAILVLNNKIVGTGFNRPIITQDPTAHAEIAALRDAGKINENYRLPNTTLYVTLEPCVMCIGAMLHARIKHLVFGAYDKKIGAVNILHLLDTNVFNHKISYCGGVLELECATLLSNFFKKCREKN